MHHRDGDAGGQLCRAVDPLGSFLKIRRLCFIDFHEFLRVAVHQGEPRALDLHHNAMAATKGLEDIEKLEFHLVWLAGLKWHGVLEALAELTAEGLASHKLFVTA